MIKVLVLKADHGLRGGGAVMPVPSIPRFRKGVGYLAGDYPDGITSVNSIPVSAIVRVLYRPTSGEPGDGTVVAETLSGVDGTWRVSGLNPDFKYDVVSRYAGRNDVIQSNVSPEVD